MTESLYHQVITITEDYLGPAAPRFVDRQIMAHLGKPPHELNSTDLAKLTEWTQITLGLLTQNRQLITEYAERMTELTQATSSAPNNAGRNP